MFPWCVIWCLNPRDVPVMRDCRIPRYTLLQNIISRVTWSDVLFHVSRDLMSYFTWHVIWCLIPHDTWSDVLFLVTRDLMSYFSWHVIWCLISRDTWSDVLFPVTRDLMSYFTCHVIWCLISRVTWSDVFRSRVTGNKTSDHVTREIRHQITWHVK